MANNFSKEEIVNFEDQIAKFEDGLVISAEIDKYTPGDAQTMERSSDRIWRPQPYNPTVYDGIDQTANFGDITQLAVPVTVSNFKSVNWTMSPTDLRDPVQMQKYMSEGINSLASRINTSAYQTAFNWGTLVSKRTTTPTGFDDIADEAAIMTEQGVSGSDRKTFYSPRDYLPMASQLAKPMTSSSPLAATAYERAYVRAVGGFDVFENDQGIVLPAAAGVGVTITNTQPLYYTPVGSTKDVDGNTTNVDNRTQTISIAVTSGTVKVGDAFTIAGVFSLHQISKQPTTQLKTFRVMQIVTGAGGTGTVKISPPIISNGGGTKAELEYQNVSGTPANGAAITFLNTVNATGNVFFKKQALVLVPGSFVVETGVGWETMKATTKNGINVSYTRQGGINNLAVKARLDVRYGVAALAPEMMGIQLFRQT